MGKSGDERALEPLLDVLKLTDNPAVLDAVAVALRDLGDARALRPLLDLIADKKTEGHRGTLLYALGGFDCAGILPRLVQLVIDGNFEVSRQAFTVIESIESEIDPEDWKSSVATLRSAQDAADEDERPLWQELLERFEESE